jgi:hypothetical protein
MTMGRPSSYTPELLGTICERLSKGEPMATICRDEGMPDPSTVWRWAESDENISQIIARARVKGFDAIAENALEIIDETPPVTATGGIDSGHVSWAKARVETRLKLLAKWDPKRYGDRLDLNHGGELRVIRQTFAPDGDHKDS